MEDLYSVWPTISLDLKTHNINEDKITNFSLSLDGVIQSIKSQDKNNTLVNLLNMYMYIPIFSSSIIEEQSKQDLYNTKLNILNAYVLASTSDKWNDITLSITSAKNFFSNIISSQDENKIALQKSYVIIEDLERISQINDVDIFFMGYKNVMQELETINL